MSCCSNRPCFIPMWRFRQNAERGRVAGFILVFTLWILAACTMILGVIGLGAGGRAAVGDRELLEMVETRQLVSLLDFVLRNSAEFEIPLDPRLAAFEKVAADRAVQLATQDDRLAILRQILAAMKFDLNLADPRNRKPDEKATPGAAAGPARGQVENSAAATVRYFPRADNYTIVINGVTFSISVLPGNGRPSLGATPPAAVARYLVHLGVDPAEARRLADDLADWVDGDGQAREGGSEAAIYARLEPPRQPRNRPFESWGEVAFVRGVSPDRLRLLRDHFSLSGGLVHHEYIDEKRLAALAGVDEGRMRPLLEWFKQPERTDLNRESVRPEDQAALLQVATGNLNVVQILVRITGPHAGISAWYDTQRKRILDWSLD